MSTYVYYKVRTKHAWGCGDWETHEYHLGDTEAWEAAEKEIAEEIHGKFDWSDKYRGVDIERLDVPPKEWVANQIAGEKRSILWAQERIKRLELLLKEPS